ncbi:diaminopimelate epimerase [Wenzhouxiangella sediminis]|uniref:Diaminopimelate epimerase n=1 Tax=Wenzhouxiangella sediminis TaxID=1792836 RepID=A0A3E1K608_9GAMM|nr:diaminopimelate epimerase [Wenzhouxiangella sediminis]RFF29445.1 diaminopimelate epimerase [Wenzhouxiangella sediminis]
MPEERNDALAFFKLEALGNDFMLVDARQRDFEPGPGQVRQWADRRRGVGFDQLLVLRPSDRPGHHCRVEIHNADGSRAEQCGNGMRAVALWLSRHEGARHELHLETAGGSVETRYRSDDEISATLGVPDFDPRAVGLADTPTFPRRFTVDGEELDVHGASMGNPHLLVIEDEEPGPRRLDIVGRTLGGHADLAHGANVGLAVVESPHRVRLRVFERGAGPTLACGSGASAAAAILLRLGRVEAPVEVIQPGGTLVVNWPGRGQVLTTTGPARLVFEGVIRCRTQAG